MALKSYEELVKVDVSQYCEKRDGFTYLNWAKCIELLRQNGATEVYWEPIPDPQTGSSLRKTDIEFKDKNNNTNRCYETRIKVVIDDKEYEMQTPVMNGANPVKDNSMSQQRVWNSMCRAFVKCVAIHTGLGFNLWLKEEYNKLEAQIPGTGENLASEAKKKTLKTQCTAHGIDLEAWVCGNGKTVDTLTETECAMMLNAINLSTIHGFVAWCYESMLVFNRNKQFCSLLFSKGCRRDYIYSCTESASRQLKILA